MSDGDPAASGRAARAFDWLYSQPGLLLTTTMTLWAGNTIIGRFISGEIPPFGLTFFRWIVAFAAILPFAWPYLKRDLPVIVRDWKAMLILSGSGAAGFNAFNYYGLQDTTALNGLILQSASPLMIALAAFLLFRDRLTLLQSAGISISLAGVLTVVLRGNFGLLADFSPNPGDIWILVAMACNGVFAACMRLRPRVHWLSFLAATSAIAIVIMAIPTIGEMWQGRVVPVTWESVWVLAYVGVGASLLAHLCFNRGIELMGANRGGAFFHLHPMIGSVMAIVLLGEQPALFHGLGFLLIMAGVALATRRAR